MNTLHRRREHIMQIGSSVGAEQRTGISVQDPVNPLAPPATHRGRCPTRSRAADFSYHLNFSN